MASAQIEHVVNVYKRLSEIPDLVDAVITPEESNCISLKSVWSQRNLERNTTQNFLQQYTFNLDLHPISKSFPADISTELLSASSKDQTLKAVLRRVTVDGKAKQFIEIWDKQHRSKSYDLSAFDVHGDVYTGDKFSSFQISLDNSKLLYVAEKKLPKNEPFYKQKPKPKSDKPKSDDDEEPSKGTEYVYKPDWGEQLVGKHRSVVVILNINEDTIVPIDSIPDDYFPAQVIWAPNGEDIVGVAYKLRKRYLGLYACTNRESYIFHLKGKDFSLLTPEGHFCTSPRLSPDGINLIWYERKINPAHKNVLKLMLLKWDTDKPEIIIDVVKTSIDIANGRKFYGIYADRLPKRCWGENSKLVFFSTPQRSNVKSYVVNLETKIVTEINCPDGSGLSILDVNKDFMACKKFSVIKPDQLCIGKFNLETLNSGNLKLIECSETVDVLEKENLLYEDTEIVLSNSDAVKDFNFKYFGKRSELNKSTPLIAIGHGGPHANYCNYFIMDYAFFALLGFGVLQINYRGSTGMGGDNVDYLLGKAGKVDVEDCVTAIDEALKKYPWLNPENVNLYGGSHGGFINAHLSGQYPDKFKSVILLNPVTDIAAMFSVTDIPDWCRAEAGLNSILEILPEQTTENENYSELLIKMVQHSPILHVNKVKVPTLVAIGTKDLRVPPVSQGKRWYDQLVANNVPAKLLVYEDNHSIRKSEFDIDSAINFALWFLEHNGK